MTRMKAYYKETVAPALFKKFGYKSTMQVPKLDKIIINVGCGEAKENAKVVDAIMSDLMQITGQKPIVCRAKKSVLPEMVQMRKCRKKQECRALILLCYSVR